MKSIDVIIVNFRTKELSVQAARSVLDDPLVRHVYITENGSGDDSAEYMRKALAGTRTSVLESSRNLGFGGGNNLAVRESASEYVFFLNSDAYVEPGCLGALVEAMKSDVQLGLAAPIVHLADGVTEQPDAQGIFPTPLAIISRRTTRAVTGLTPDWVSGVAFMARREEFLAIGGFDERLFMYYEDIDLCRRYRLAGKEIRRIPAAAVTHLGGMSRQSTYRQKQMYFASQDRYMELSGALPISRLMVKICRSPYVIIGKLFLWK